MPSATAGAQGRSQAWVIETIERPARERLTPLPSGYGRQNGRQTSPRIGTAERLSGRRLAGRGTRRLPTSGFTQQFDVDDDTGMTSCPECRHETSVGDAEVLDAPDSKGPPTQPKWRRCSASDARTVAHEERWCAAMGPQQAPARRRCCGRRAERPAGDPPLRLAR